MANVTITELPVLSTMTDVAVVPVVAGGVTQQITGSSLKTYFSSGVSTPGGSNTQVQFNDSDTFGGVSSFTFNKVTGTLTVNNVVQNGVGNINGYNAFFANNVTIQGTMQAEGLIIPTGSGTFVGDDPTGNNALFVGVSGFTALGSDIVAQFSGNANSYSQINFQNINPGTFSSTDLVLTANNGTDSANYFNMGISGNTYSNPAYTAYSPNDGYLLVDGGNLLINLEDPTHEIKIVIGSYLVEDTVATFDKTDFNIVTNFLALGNIGTEGTFNALPVALGNLVATAGARAFINNGNLTAAGNFGAQVGSGGSNVVPVWSDGANWYIG
jgi:hypothetical protein